MQMLTMQELGVPLEEDGLCPGSAIKVFMTWLRVFGTGKPGGVSEEDGCAD